MNQLNATPYIPGRVRGFIRHGKEAASRDGLVVISQAELKNFQGPCIGLIVIDGLPLSHTMIRLLGYAIPTVIITQEQAEQLDEGAELILDGDSGHLLAPELEAQYPAAAKIEAPSIFASLQTSDGERVMLRASVDNRHAMARAHRNGASTIGSLRSEYLGFKSRTQPPAEFYTTELGMCCHEAEPLPLILRLPDYSSEKLPSWYSDKAEQLSNSARGARLYNREPFKSVLAGLLEGVASVAEYYDIRLLLPYVTHPEEFRYWRNAIEAALPMPVSLGAMIETPAAAMMIKEFIAEADFIALGCNDLMEGLFGCDRSSEYAERYLDPYAPAIYRLLQHIAQEAGNRCQEIQVDGQLSRLPGVIPILIGLGYRIFSVDPIFIPRLAQSIRDTDREEAETLAQAVCSAENTESVKEILSLGGKP